jgi:hypothetical protein
MNRLVLNRRKLLRGMLHGAAVAIALPPLEAMLDTHGEAYADGTPIPRRFGLWSWGNGVKNDSRWMPSVTGTAWQTNPPESLAPFTQVQVDGVSGVAEYVSVVSNTWVPYPFSWAHWTSWVAMMTASQPLDAQGTPDYQTGSFPIQGQGPFVMDQITAALGQQTAFPRIDVGISRAVFSGDYLTGDPTSSLYNPDALFNKLFGGFTAQPTMVPQVVIRAKQSILDAVKADVLALKQRLGRADQGRLDAHLASVAAIESSISSMKGPPVCQVPQNPGPRPPDLGQGGEPLTEVNKAMSDLLAYALACDLTRVFNVTFMDVQTSPHFLQVNVLDAHHALGHDEPAPQPKVQATTVYMMQQLAYLVAKLKSIPVGAGNLLDSCCVWGTSEIEDPTTHAFRNIPQLIIGRAGGLRGGVYHDAQGDPDWYHRTDVPGAIHANLLLTMMQAVGMNVASFGVGDGQSRGVVAEIMR